MLYYNKTPWLIQEFFTFAPYNFALVQVVFDTFNEDLKLY